MTSRLSTAHEESEGDVCFKRTIFVGRNRISGVSFGVRSDVFAWNILSHMIASAVSYRLLDGRSQSADRRVQSILAAHERFLLAALLFRHPSSPRERSASARSIREAHTLMEFS